MFCSEGEWLTLELDCDRGSLLMYHQGQPYGVGFPSGLTPPLCFAVSAEYGSDVRIVGGMFASKFTPPLTPAPTLLSRLTFVSNIGHTCGQTTRRRF